MTRVATRRVLAVVVTALGVTGCGSAESQGSPLSTVAGPTAETTIAATTTATPSASPTGTASAPAGPSAWDIDWAIDFGWMVPAEWQRDVNENLVGMTTGSTTWLGGPTGRYVALTRSGPETIDAWLELLRSSPRLALTEAEPVEIGGASGVVLDATGLPQEGETACQPNDECSVLFADDGGYWPILEGRPARIWLLDVEGETVLIVTDAPQASFDAWVAEVEEALGTLEWRP